MFLYCCSATLSSFFGVGSAAPAAPAREARSQPASRAPVAPARIHNLLRFIMRLNLPVGAPSPLPSLHAVIGKVEVGGPGFSAVGGGLTELADLARRERVEIHPPQRLATLRPRFLGHELHHAVLELPDVLGDVAVVVHPG